MRRKLPLKKLSLSSALRDGKDSGLGGNQGMLRGLEMSGRKAFHEEDSVRKLEDGKWSRNLGNCREFFPRVRDRGQWQ